LDDQASAAPGAPVKPGQAAAAAPAVARFVTVALVASLLLIGAYYAILYFRLNAAPAFAGPFAPAGGEFATHVETCRTTRTKVAIAGWAARRGLQRGSNATRVVFREAASGRLFAMRTDLVRRPDVTAALNPRFGDTINYDNSGFAASLNLAAAGLGPGTALLAFDNGGVYSLLPLPCP
jgi:hypothetical protein